MVRSPTASARNGVLGSGRVNILLTRLPVLRAALEQQHDFRREQLAHVHVHQPDPGPPTDDPADRDQDLTTDLTQALREVEALVTAGARRALADIELAMARMHTGRYGYCRVCGTGIPFVVLEAIPATTVCLACQQFIEHAKNQPAAAESAPFPNCSPLGEAGTAGGFGGC